MQRRESLVKMRIDLQSCWLRGGRSYPEFFGMTPVLHTMLA